MASTLPKKEYPVKKYYRFVRYYNNGVDLEDMDGTSHFRSLREYKELIRRGAVVESVPHESMFA